MVERALSAFDSGLCVLNYMQVECQPCGLGLAGWEGGCTLILTDCIKHMMNLQAINHIAKL